MSAGVPAEAITVPGQACEGAFERWLMNAPVLVSGREEDIAHDAFRSSWEAAAAQAVAAERERIRQALLTCTKCGEIHRLRRVTYPASRNGTYEAFEADSWAGEDGHPYWARWLTTHQHGDMNSLIDGAP